MTNPYQAPQSDVAEPRPSQGKVYVVISLVTAAFCIMRFLYDYYGLFIFLTAVDLEQVSIFGLVNKVALPLVLVLGGIFLALGRKFSAIFFATYIIQSIVQFIGDGRFNLFIVTVAFIFLSYSLWLWKAGHLRGWPNNSFKPTPPRGAD
jgi:hypothetical protein